MTRRTDRYEKPHPETVWPTIEAAGELEWKLRNDPDSMTRSDHLVAASVMAAYRHLRLDPNAFERQKDFSRPSCVRCLEIGATEPARYYNKNGPLCREHYAVLMKRKVV